MSSMLFVCAREGKHAMRTKNDVVVEGNDEREEGENVISKKRARGCSTADVDARLICRPS